MGLQWRGRRLELGHRRVQRRRHALVVERIDRVLGEQRAADVHDQRRAHARARRVLSRDRDAKQQSLLWVQRRTDTRLLPVWSAAASEHVPAARHGDIRGDDYRVCSDDRHHRETVLKYPSRGPIVPLFMSVWAMPPYFLTGRVAVAATGWFTWIAANEALYFPIEIAHPVTITKAWWVNPNALGSNADVGIYDQEGNRIASTGSTAQSGSGVAQSVTLSCHLGAGLYYLAMAANNTTGQFLTAATQFWGHSVGAYQQLSAFPLPATATFAQGQLLRVPKFGLTRAPRTVV